MKKAMLIAMFMLFAMAFVVCTAMAEFSGIADPSEQKAFDAKWDESRCCEDSYAYYNPCTEICPGSYPSDWHGCHYGNAVDNCDKCSEMPHINCFVFEKCKECGKVRCDGRCNECKERCDVYEYCPICGVKYRVERADGYCDRCGRDCYCIEKCEKCGHNHYYNGYCDDCADRCYYGRCCHGSYEGIPPEHHDECETCDHESYVDAEPATFTIYLGDDVGDDAVPEMQDGYADQMPLNNLPLNEAQVAQAS